MSLNDELKKCLICRKPLGPAAYTVKLFCEKCEKIEISFRSKEAIEIKRLEDENAELLKCIEFYASSESFLMDTISIFIKKVMISKGKATECLISIKKKRSKKNER